MCIVRVYIVRVYIVRVYIVRFPFSQGSMTHVLRLTLDVALSKRLCSIDEQMYLRVGSCGSTHQRRRARRTHGGVGYSLRHPSAYSCQRGRVMYEILAGTGEDSVTSISSQIIGRKVL